MTVSIGVEIDAEDVVCVALGDKVDVNLYVLVDNEISKVCVFDCMLLLFDAVEEEEMISKLDVIGFVGDNFMDFPF